ncbi:MAG: hypothetical protein ACRDZ4_01050 [Egibacteraceae bacterium]
MERHDLDPISLVFGLAFTVLGLLFLARPLCLYTWRWVLPILDLGLGLTLFYSARRANRDR